jgi:hypothetical protein
LGELSAEQAREALWASSVRAHQRRIAEERRAELLAWHEGQAARLSNTLGTLIAYHQAEAARYRNGHEEDVSA